MLWVGLAIFMVVVAYIVQVGGRAWEYVHVKVGEDACVLCGGLGAHARF